MPFMYLKYLPIKSSCLQKEKTKREKFSYTLNRRIFHKATCKGECTKLKLLLYAMKHSDVHFP